MTRNSGGDTINQGGASKPTQAERDREFAGIAGNAAERGETPSPGERERGETGPGDEAAPIDLESAHDRAG